MKKIRVGELSDGSIEELTQIEPRFIVLRAKKYVVIPKFNIMIKKAEDYDDIQSGMNISKGDRYYTNKELEKIQ